MKGDFRRARPAAWSTVFGGEWGDPLFAAFAEAADVRTGAEVDIVVVRPVSSEIRSPVWMSSCSRA